MGNAQKPKFKVLMYTILVLSTKVYVKKNYIIAENY